jgi:hypothetical protein
MPFSFPFDLPLLLLLFTVGTFDDGKACKSYYEKCVSKQNLLFISRLNTFGNDDEEFDWILDFGFLVEFDFDSLESGLFLPVHPPIKVKKRIKLSEYMFMVSEITLHS